jgi:hypothetical protein
MNQLLLVIAIAALFYVLIPGVGAVSTRTRWRRFRAQVVNASLFPTVGYREINRSSTVAEGTRIGSFRCFGSLEAIEGDNVVWVRERNSSIACDMRGVTVFLLSAESSGGYRRAPLSDRVGIPSDPPTSARWERLSSLPEGTGMFVAGPLYADSGRPKFRAGPDQKLLVVLYDGAPETVLRRCIVTGRQRNEYWNQITPISLVAGALALLLAAYVLIQQPLSRLPAIIAGGLGLVPILPMLPPGVPLFFFYRRLWRRGRGLRAERDVLRLPLRYFGSDDYEAILPNGEPYRSVAVSRGAAERLLEHGAQYEHLPSDSNRKDLDYYAFGTPVGGAETEHGVPLRRPADPMAELVVVGGGHPSLLARRAQRRAERLELSALLTFSTTILVNLYLALIVISRVIR